MSEGVDGVVFEIVNKLTDETVATANDVGGG